jgi:signal peptidase I
LAGSATVVTIGVIVRGFTRAVLWIAGIIGAICLLLYLFLFDVWTIPAGTDKAFGAAMLPTVTVNDTVLIQRGRRPNFGELARCSNPLVSGSFVVGRVFGRAGDRVEITEGHVVTNGQVLKARHACPAVTMQHPVTENLITLNCGVAETGAWSFSYLTSDTLSGGNHATVVEAGKVYLVSDNRVMHQDARDFGLVDETTCEHVVYRLWGEKFTDSSRRFTLLW